MAQYKRQMDKAFAGLKATAAFDHVESGFAASEDIPFGYGLKVNSSNPETQCDLIDTAGDVFHGISLHEHKVGGTYYEKDPVNILRRGKAWVEISATVTAGARAYVDTTNAKFTAVVGTNIDTGGYFRNAITYSGGADRNIAILEINLPNL